MKTWIRQSKYRYWLVVALVTLGMSCLGCRAIPEIEYSYGTFKDELDSKTGETHASGAVLVQFKKSGRPGDNRFILFPFYAQRLAHHWSQNQAILASFSMSNIDPDADLLRIPILVCQERRNDTTCVADTITARSIYLFIP